jgi:hypothetical protein
VRNCLRTIYIFSDVGATLAEGALRTIGWPGENGVFKVNNSNLTLELGGDQDVRRQTGRAAVGGVI